MSKYIFYSSKINKQIFWKNVKCYHDSCLDIVCNNKYGELVYCLTDINNDRFYYDSINNIKSSDVYCDDIVSYLKEHGEIFEGSYKNVIYRDCDKDIHPLKYIDSKENFLTILEYVSGSYIKGKGTDYRYFTYFNEPFYNKIMEAIKWKNM